MTHHVRHYGGGEYGIEGRYDERVRSICKGVSNQQGVFSVEPTPGMRWEPLARAWVGSVDAVATAVSRLREKGVDVEDSELGVFQRETNNPVAPLRVHGKGFETLRQYQIEGANFILTRAEEGCLLGDEPGLGKTAQFLRAARALRHRGRAVVVVPNFVKGVWKEEAKKWWPEVELVVLEGTKPEKQRDAFARLGAPPPKDGQLVIVNYDVLHAWVSAIVSFTSPPIIVGFDEGQYLQSERSRRSKAAKMLARACKHRVALTGTPPADRPRDLWNLVDTISEGRFGGFFPYAIRYCAGHREQVTREKTVWKFDGASNLDELRERVGYFTLRRTQKDVQLELPDFQRQIVPVEVARGQRAPLRDALRSDVALRRAMDLAADGKVPHVIALAESDLDAGHKVCVFTHRRLVAEAVAEAFGDRARFYHGGMSQAARDKVLSEPPDLLAATLDTAGVGLNKLVHYDVVIFAELHWIPSVLAQAEKRLHRQGQKKNVMARYVIAEGTADELIRDGCIKKLQTRVGVLGKLDDGLLEELDRDMKEGGAAALRALAESLVA